MKTNLSKNFRAAKLAITMAALLPFVGLAASAHAETSVASFCAKVDAPSSTLDTLIGEKETSYETGKAASLKALKASRAASDKALYDARVLANVQYADQFKTLAAEATTPEQKAAVSEFRKTVLKAVETRRANVDLAVLRYREGVDAILAGRSSAYLSALNSLKASIDKNLGGSDCSGAVSAFDSKVSDMNADTDALSKLSVARDDKVNAADAKFATTVSTAAATLKTVLGQ